MNGSDTSPRTVLVVEDNPGDARLVAIYLAEERANPFRILAATRLCDALVILGAEHVDVVLLDLSLPDSFGLDTLARLRAAHPLVPVAVLTGTNDEVLALEALRRGAQDYLVKGQGDGELVRRAVRYAIERSRADRELRRSEAQVRTVFANAGIGVVLSDPDGHIIEANPAFLAMLGLDGAELSASTLRAHIHPEDIASERGLLRELEAGKRDSYQTQQRFLARDGRAVWARLTVTAVRDGDSGRLRNTVAVIEDVTERKRLEDHMRLAATVFENTGEGLFITDAARRIIHVNRAFTDITGYEPEEVLGRTPRMLASGRHDADFYARMWHSLETAGRWQGEIWDRRKTGETFVGWQNIAVVRGAGGEVSNYVAVISDITSRKEIEERLSYAANHDPLTRLPNRTLFHERLSRALARATRSRDIVAVLFADLDRFKEVNDTLGHLAGDLLLQQVAERLSRSIRQGDTVARLAGDEFTIILEDIQAPRDAAVVAHKILRTLSEPFDLNGAIVGVSASVGVAVYPSDAGDVQTLVKLADAAMYRAKHLGRACCQFHSEAVNALAFERLALEEALARAIDRQELALHYQPIYDLASGRIAAVEALVRWHHPEVGLVLPTQFLSLAEDSGQILPIGRWVLATACRQARLWHEQGFAVDLAVNLSPRQAHHAELPEWVAEALEETRFPADSLVLEIPESVVIESGPDASIFARLVALGVHIAIDEFGAGYSSFTFLRRLPADQIKISQSFVRNVAASPDDAEIATAIVAVARGLHLSVTAPGIETEAQLSALASRGCDRGQGFLLAHPTTPEGITDALRHGTIPAALAELSRMA